MNAYTPVKARAKRLVDLSARYSDASGHAAHLRFLWKKHAWYRLVGALRRYGSSRRQSRRHRRKARASEIELCGDRHLHVRPARIQQIHTLVPSGRGELEITDVNNMYRKEGTMTSALLEGWWTDAGMFDSLLRDTNLVAESRIQNKVEVLAT
jgi:hypothetical protein